MTNTTEFERLVPIRNRLAHNRPLNIEDADIVLGLLTPIARGSKPIPWFGLSEAIRKSDRLLTAQPATLDTFEAVRLNNLPIPDFEDTGFIGRERESASLLDWASGQQWPVMTIAGEGGIGKSALALKVAYELLEKPETSFDAIVWTTAKTQQLSIGEIKRIEGAITTSLGVFNSALDFLDSSTSKEEVRG